MYNPPKRVYMPTYRVEGSHSAKGLQELAKDKALGGRSAVKDALADLGGARRRLLVVFALTAATAGGLIGTRTINPGFSALDRVAVSLGRSNL
jgi:hypothetical protein